MVHMMHRHDEATNSLSPGALGAIQPDDPHTNRARRHVLVVGGGASGVLLAAQLLRRGGGCVKVTVIEKGPMLGCGVAYSTTDPAHLLNTRVANMSAFPSLPDHFGDWLRTEGRADVDPQGFVTRETYGRYMGCLLDPWAGSPLLRLVRSECVSLDATPGGVVSCLAGGQVIEADVAVLATGHALPTPDHDPDLSQPWERPPGPLSGPVLIVGSGLTMVDQVLSLMALGHAGPITVISRRGLLPQVHAPTDPVCWRAAELPDKGAVAPLTRWLRAQARMREAQGGNWRDVVDGLRPHLQAIWRALPPRSRRAFLRHASPYWEVHRHRMPPTSYARLCEAMATGRLQLMRGRFEGTRRDSEGRLRACIAGPGGEQQEMMASRIIDCRGIRRDPEAHATPLVADLLAKDHATIDQLRLGLDVGPDCAVLRADGTANERLYAMGPASRAAFWEITAIPDIRVQAERLAMQLLGTTKFSEQLRLRP